MMALSRRASAGLLIVLFLVAFLVRAYHPLSRPDQWLNRSGVFYQALASGDWASTYQSRHPGVTVMAIGGPSLRLLRAVSGTPAEFILSWASPSFTTEFGQRMAAGVIGLSLAASLLIVASALCLKKLSGWPVAFAAGGLMALSPFYISMGKVFHVDGLLGAFMLLSVLLLLVYLKERRWLYLILSGVVGGLALLTKTPALFLFPFTGLALGVYALMAIWSGWREQHSGRFRWLALTAGRALVLPLLVWILCVGLPFLLWPAMWVNPGFVLNSMFSGTLQHVETPHPVPRFFAGRIYYDSSPGLAFYPVTLFYNSTFVTITMIVLSLGHYLLWRRRAAKPLASADFWLLVACVVFFTIQMTLAAKKDKRYVLPVHPVLEVLAAVGLAGLVDLVRDALPLRLERLRPALPALVVGLGLSLQAAAVLPYAPDYGAHRNHLLAGNRSAVRVIEIMNQNEGVIHAARYLNRQLQPESRQVWVAYPLGFSLPQYFAGQVVTGYAEEAAAADYFLFSYVPMQRDIEIDRWKPAWDAYQARGQPPLLVVRYDGVDYLWLYGPLGEDAGIRTTVVNRGGGLVMTIIAWVWTVLVGAVLVRARVVESSA